MGRIPDRDGKRWFWTMKERILTRLGLRVVHGGATAPFSISSHDRLSHTHVIGQPGTGKSTFLENSILGDIQNGFGVAVIDPKGDLARRVLDRIPPGRADDVVYFDPSDKTHLVPLNILALNNNVDRDFVINNAVETLGAFWPTGMMDRALHILKRLILTLQASGRPQTLLGVPRLLFDDNFRRWIVYKRADKNRSVANFWYEQYSKKWSRGQRTEWTMSVVNKLDLFNDHPLKFIIGQARNTFNIRRAMDDGKIIIINLAKGRIGEKNANLLGSLWASALKASAFGRDELEEATRLPFYGYFDEFQTFTTTAFISALAEGRGLGFGLTVAHQGLGQLTPEIKGAVQTNTSNLTAFRVGGTTAEELQKQFNNEVSPGQLTELDNYQAYMKAKVGKESLIPFRILMHPPQFESLGMRKQIIKHSRKNFAVNRHEISRKHRRWEKAYDYER